MVPAVFWARGGLLEQEKRHAIAWRNAIPEHWVYLFNSIGGRSMVLCEFGFFRRLICWRWRVD